MSVINSEIDRKTKQEAFWAEGVVEFVKLDKFQEVKVSYIKQAGQPDKKIESTHKASILIKEKGASRDDAGVWIGLGDVKLHPEHENLQVKKDDEWITIERGVEVTLDVKPSEYNGKTYYNSSKGKIFVVSTEGVQSKPAKPSKSDSTGDTPAPYDNTGQLVGHAVGGAASLAEKGIKGELLELGEIFHAATTAAKEEIAKRTSQNPNGKNLGMSVGNAMNSAVKLISKTEKDVEGFLVEKAIEIYFNVTVPLTESIKAGSKGKTTKVEKPADKPVEQPEAKPQTPSEPPVDFDDDIPF